MGSFFASNWLPIACLFAAGAGLVLILFGLRGDRARGRRRCPKCWYDLSAAKDMLCPECGWRGKGPTDLLRTRRRWKAAAVGLVLVLAAVGTLFGAGLWRRIRLWFLPAWIITRQTVVASDYVVQILDRTDDQYAGAPRVLRILHHGQVVWQAEGFYWECGGQWGPPNGPGLPPNYNRAGLGDDVTGDGLPDLVITWLSGGSGGYARTYIFTIDPGEATPTLTPDAVINFPGWFERHPSGKCRFVAFESTYAYWWTSGAGSHRPRVVLRFESGRWIVDAEMMRHSAPDDEQIAAWVSAARADQEPNWSIWVSEVLAHAIDLIYSGREAAAWKFLDDAWPERFAADKAARFEELREQLMKSPFAAEVRELNRR